jgi:glycosyltransferase involved in cell wall biosynthesis
MIRVSVIVPAFQAEASIGRAVRSALDQTLRDLEVIVVDDGSTDGTADAARQAAANDERFRLIVQPHNAGVSAARNAALDIARGTWIALLDADDAFAAERLERMVPAAEEAGADLYADHVLLEGEGRRTEPLFAVPQRFLRTGMDAARFVALDSPTRPLGFMKPLMRRTFIEAHMLRYPAGIGIGEDFHLYVQCLMRGARLVWSAGADYVATARSGSLSRSGSERAFASFVNSTRILHDEAIALGQRRTARALARRSHDVRSYGTYDRLSDALHRHRLFEAIRIFGVLSLQSYTWRRLGGAVGRRLAPQWSKLLWR